MTRRNILISVGFLIIVLLFLLGCSRSAPAKIDQGEPAAPNETPAEAPAAVAEPEAPEPADNDTAQTVDAKQLAVGGATDIKTVNVTLISDIKCSFTADGPEKFSFRLTNVEDKVWKFKGLSYDERESADNPIAVLNALQVTNEQMIVACGSRSIQPGTSVLCDFNLEAPEHILVRKNLRTGVTALGNVNENTLMVKTSSHAAEIKFLCEP